MAMALVYIAGNYLRARGEYMPRRVLTTWLMELPPRTRRIRVTGGVDLSTIGTTSAHAENTLERKPPIGLLWNYLRARGEYFLDASALFIRSELPPRTRRIPPIGVLDAKKAGTTSAHAENTHH